MFKAVTANCNNLLLYWSQFRAYEWTQNAPNQIMQLIIVYSRVILHMNYILITSITCNICRSLYEVATLYREEITLMEQNFTAILQYPILQSSTQPHQRFSFYSSTGQSSQLSGSRSSFVQCSSSMQLAPICRFKLTAPIHSKHIKNILRVSN